MKRSISWILAIIMLISSMSVLSTLTFAADSTADGNRVYAYQASVTIDGSGGLNEPNLMVQEYLPHSIRYGAAWDYENIYLIFSGIDGEHIEDVHITLGSAAVSLTSNPEKGKGDITVNSNCSAVADSASDYVEVAIPLSAVELKEVDDELCADLGFMVISESGSQEVFSTLILSGRSLVRRNARYDGSGTDGKDGFSSLYSEADDAAVTGKSGDGIELYRTYDNSYYFKDAEVGAKQVGVSGNLLRIIDLISPYKGCGMYVEYDLNVKSLPEYDGSLADADSIGNFGNQLPYIMFLIGGREDLSTSSGPRAYIHNKKGVGLVLSIGLDGDLFNEIPLADYGIELDDEFRLGLQTNVDGSLDIYINNKFVKSIAARVVFRQTASSQGGYMIVSTQRSCEMKAGEMIEFYMRNYGISVLNTINKEEVLALSKNGNGYKKTVAIDYCGEVAVDGIADECYTNNFMAGSLSKVKAAIDTTDDTLNLIFKIAAIDTFKLRSGKNELTVSLSELPILDVGGKDIGTGKVAKASGIDGAAVMIANDSTSAYDSAEVSVPLSALDIKTLDSGKKCISLELTLSKTDKVGEFVPSILENTSSCEIVFDYVKIESAEEKITPSVINKITGFGVSEITEMGGALTLTDNGAPNRMRSHATKTVSMIRDGQVDVVISADITVNDLPEIPLAKALPEVGSYAAADNKLAWATNSTECPEPRVVFISTRHNGLAKGNENITYSIYNTEEKGLVLVISLFDYSTQKPYREVVELGKKVGDSFNLAVSWKQDGSGAVLVDSKVIAEFDRVTHFSGNYSFLTANRGIFQICFVRNRTLTQDEDVNVIVSNITMSDKPIITELVEQPIKLTYVQTSAPANEKSDTRFISTVSSLAFTEVGYEVRVAGTSDVKKISTNKVYTSFINGGQKITAQKGKYFVILSESDIPAGEGTYTLIVRPYAVKDGKTYYGTSYSLDYENGALADSKTHNYTYFITQDIDPFSGRELEIITDDKVYTLDELKNSVVYDMGITTKVNRIKVTSVSNDFNSINKNSLAVYYSEDNVTYKYLDNFSILQTGNSLYFYNFEVDARYIKVNSTENTVFSGGGVIKNSVENFITVSYSDKPLLAEGDFLGNTTVNVKNEKDEVAYDTVFKFTLDDLGIEASALKEDMSDIRFVLKNLYLPHYCSDGVFYVRVSELEANEEAEITVLYGNSSALSVSDGNEVFEVQYGTKYAWAYTTTGWQHCVFEAPNGDILKIVCTGGMLKYYRSEDGGLTFGNITDMPISKDVINSMGGVIVDFETGTIFCFAYKFQYRDASKGQNADGSYVQEYDCKYKIFTSTDNGYTWSEPVTPTNHPEYALSYSDGIKLKDADGEGPNVDYVFTTGVMRDLDHAAFCTSAIYSKDGGKSWTFSDSKINYEYGSSTFHEGGLSEDCVYQMEDGTLVFYARCQIADVPHFAKSYSKDYGVTWSDITDETLSNFFTTNTQPILETMDGVPVFLWGGNNSLGGTTYLRFPLNLAPSYDDAETFVDIIDASLQTVIATASRSNGRSLHTNPDVAFYKKGDINMCYIVSTSHEMYIINADDYLYKTKGAFDSFESGAHVEGWSLARGKYYTSKIGATEGDKAMRIMDQTVIMRPLHYIEEGSVSFDITASSFGTGAVIELQTAYNDYEGVTAPIRLKIDSDGNLYYYAKSHDLDNEIALGLKIEEGVSSRITIDFNGNTDEATITVDGETAELEYIDGIDNYISYATIFTKTETDISIDRFIAERTDR